MEAITINGLDDERKICFALRWNKNSIENGNEDKNQNGNQLIFKWLIDRNYAEMALDFFRLCHSFIFFFLISSFEALFDTQHDPLTLTSLHNQMPHKQYFLRQQRKAYSNEYQMT